MTIKFLKTHVKPFMHIHTQLPVNYRSTPKRSCTVRSEHPVATSSFDSLGWSFRSLMSKKPVTNKKKNLKMHTKLLEMSF